MAAPGAEKIPRDFTTSQSHRLTASCPHALWTTRPLVSFELPLKSHSISLLPSFRYLIRRICEAQHVLAGATKYPACISVPVSYSHSISSIKSPHACEVSLSLETMSPNPQNPFVLLLCRRRLTAIHRIRSAVSQPPGYP